MTQTLTPSYRPTSYVLPVTDRSAVAATAISLNQPPSREAQLRAENAQLKAELASLRAAEAKAKADAEAQAQAEAQAKAEASQAKAEAAQARLIEQARMGRAAMDREERDQRIRRAPGFREVDGIQAWMRRAGLNRHHTCVAITGSQVRVTDLA
jgi:hypothetical protein